MPVACRRLSFRLDEDGDLLPWEGEGPGTRAIAPVAGTGPRDGTAGGVVRERHGSRELAGLPGSSTPGTPRGTP